MFFLKFHNFLWVKKPDVFFTIIKNPIDLYCINVNMPAYKDEFFQLLFKHPDQFKTIISDQNKLKRMAQWYPEYLEIFSAETVDVAAKKALEYCSIRASYTRGSILGLFENTLPTEVSFYLCTFFTRSDANRIALVNQNAYETANAEMQAEDDYQNERAIAKIICDSTLN